MGDRFSLGGVASASKAAANILTPLGIFVLMTLNSWNTFVMQRGQQGPANPWYPFFFFGFLFAAFSQLLIFSCLIKMPIKCMSLIATRSISGCRKNRNTHPKPANGTQVNYKLQMAPTPNKYHQQPQALIEGSPQKSGKS